MSMSVNRKAGTVCALNKVIHTASTVKIHRTNLADFIVIFIR